MKQLVFILFFIIHSIYSFSQETGLLQSSLKQAAEEHKHILLYFSGSDWCKPCIVMKKNVINTEQFQNFAEERLHIIELDFPRDEANLTKEHIQFRDSVAENYNPEGKFPYLLLLDKNGQISLEIDGYKNQTTEEIIQTLKSKS